MTCPATIPLFIVNYNGLSNLGSTFLGVIEKAVNASTHLDCLKVILVDNGSSDGSLDVVMSRFWDTVLPVRIKSNLGHAMGVNVAIKRYASISGRIPRYAFVMDNDYVIMEPDGLRDLIEYMKRDPRTVAVQGVNLRRDGRVGDAGALYTTFIIGMLRCSGLRVSECPEKASYVSSVISCLALYNVKIVLSKRKLFFNHYTITHNDDVDLSLEMWSYGYTSTVVPTIVGVHYGGLTREKMGRAFPSYDIKRSRILLHKRFSRLVKARSLLFPSIRELPNIPFRLAIHGREQALILTRAFLDALTTRIEPFKGPYEPLLVKLPVKELPRTLLRYKLSRSDRLITLVISEKMLRASPRPFIVPYTL